MNRPCLVIVLISVMSLLQAGCYESPDVALHEPGVYKGVKDPLLGKLEDRKLQARLHKRLLTVQTDR